MFAFERQTALNFPALELHERDGERTQHRVDDGHVEDSPVHGM